MAFVCLKSLLPFPPIQTSCRPPQNCPSKARLWLWLSAHIHSSPMPCDAVSLPAWLGVLFRSACLPASYSRTPFSHAHAGYSLLVLSLMSPCLWPAFEYFSLACQSTPSRRLWSLWLQQLPPPTFSLATHPHGHTLEFASPKSTPLKSSPNHSSEWLLVLLSYSLKICC